MGKFKSQRNANQIGLAVAGITSSTVADDLHTEDNQGNSRPQKSKSQKNP